jgi:hypothetical protein
MACSGELRMLEISNPRHMEAKPSKTVKNIISKYPLPINKPLSGTGRLNKTIETKITD